MKPSEYVFDYEREVEGFYADHPKHKGRIFFLDVASHELRGYKGAEAEKIKKILNTNHEVGCALAIRDRERGSEAVYYPTPGYSCVFLDTRPYKERLIRLVAGPEASDIENVFTLDHEIGHLICPGGIEKFNLRECVADAYATIRHIQRFGADSPYLHNIVHSRAVGLVFERGEGSHFTSPVTERIIADIGTVDFGALTPAETVALASRYAREHALPVQMVREVSRSFGAFRGRFSEVANQNFKPLRELGEKILKTRHPQEAKWGRVALRAVFNGKVIYEDRAVALPSDSFEKLRRALNAGGKP